MKNNSKDSLGDRIKLYEAVNNRILIPRLPVVCRLDGKGFHTYLKGVKKPFDTGVQDIMDGTTKFLVEQTKADIGYTQSDEITLVFNRTESDRLGYSDRVDKINSIFASMASAKFNQLVPTLLPAKDGKLAFFDCRVFNVPDLMEAANCLIWRELDASRNSVSMSAQSMFSHKTLQGLSGDQMQEKMFQEKGVNWNDYPVRFKRGAYFKRIQIAVPVKKSLTGIPDNVNMPLTVLRSSVGNFELPKLSSIENVVDVLFYGAEVKIKENL